MELTNITLIYNNNNYLQKLYPFGKNKTIYWKDNINELYKFLNNYE